MLLLNKRERHFKGKGEEEGQGSIDVTEAERSVEWMGGCIEG